MNVKIYGSRGSMPFFNRCSIRRGGNTSCVRVDTVGHTFIIDCGSGIAQFGQDMSECTDSLAVDILLSHLHIDHIIGLTVFSPIWNKHNDIRIFTKSRNDLPLSTQVFGFFKPPYWPVDLEKMNQSKLIEINATDAFTPQNGVTVTPFESEHDDGTTAFRIDADKSIVYMLDYEVNKDSEKFEKLINYCANADLIIFDSAYLSEDYPKKRGWGHSSFEHGMLLLELSQAKQMVFSHFSPEYSDCALETAFNSIGDDRGKYILAYDGLEIII